MVKKVAVVLALGVMLLLSGFVVPIRLFPDWARDVVLALPFATMTQIPCDVFLERFAGAGALMALAGQAAWAIVLLALAQALVVVATRRVVTQGG